MSANVTVNDIKNKQRENHQFALNAIELIPTGGIVATQAGREVFPHGQGSVHVKEIKIPKGQPISYPLEWFNKNKWQKPSLTVPVVPKKTSAKGLMDKIMSLINESAQVDSLLIRSFFYKVMSPLKYTLNLDWVSMGVVIGAKGSEISPFDLVKESKTTGSEQVEVIGGDQNVDYTKTFASFATLITGTFRICQATNATYQTTLTAQLTRILDGTMFKAAVEQARLSLVDAFSDEELVKMFAVLDMYFNMFPKSLYAKIRVGTIILSYKDCSALSSAAHGASIMLKTTKEFSKWLLTPALRADFYRLNIPCQEVSRPYSYMPYMMALKLAERSPYSASANPTLHLFVHLIGCAYHIKRSLNALYVDCSGLKSVLSNVFLFVYAHERTRDLDPQYYTKEDVEDVKTIRDYYKNLSIREAKEAADRMKEAQEESNKDKSKAEKSTKQTEEEEPTASDFDEGANPEGDNYEDDDRFIDVEPSECNPLQWLRHLSHFKGSVPAFMREIIYDAWSKIEDPRPNTIGEYARNLGRNPGCL